MITVDYEWIAVWITGVDYGDTNLNSQILVERAPRAPANLFAGAAAAAGARLACPAGGATARVSEADEPHQQHRPGRGFGDAGKRRKRSGLHEAQNFHPPVPGPVAGRLDDVLISGADPGRAALTAQQLTAAVSARKAAAAAASAAASQWVSAAGGSGGKSAASAGALSGIRRAIRAIGRCRSDVSPGALPAASEFATRSGRAAWQAQSVGPVARIPRPPRQTGDARKDVRGRGAGAAAAAADQEPLLDTFHDGDVAGSASAASAASSVRSLGWSARPPTAT